MGHLAYFFQFRNTVLLIQAGAILLLISTALTWVAVDAPGAQRVELSGAEMAPIVRTIGMLAVVAGVLTTLFRGWFRGALGAVLLGGGIIAGIAVILAMVDPVAAASAASAGNGVAEAAYSTGGALWAGLVGSLALLIGALAVLLFSQSWDDEAEPGRSADRRGSAR